MHGIDDTGRFVDTPDVTWKGQILNCGWWKVNVGIPYGWGNASTLNEFELGIKEGKYVGNVPEYATLIENIDEIQQGDVFAIGSVTTYG